MKKDKIIQENLDNSNEELRIYDVMRSSSKKNNFLENTIKLAKKLGYKVLIKDVL